MPNQLGITNMNDMFESGVFMRDRLLFWRFIPGKTYNKISPHYKGALRINSIGFREREISRDKAPGVYRIFCLGGSSTCGEAVYEGERFSNILEQRLNNELKPLYFEVYNFGGPGYSTLQMLRLLENELIDYKPDLVIVNPEQADRWLLSSKAPFPDSKIKVLSPALFNLTCFLERESYMYRFVKQFSFDFSWSYKSKNKNIDRKEFKFVRVSPEEHKANLARMLDICRRNHIDAVFLASLVVEAGKVFNIYKDYDQEPCIDIISLFKNSQEEALFLPDDHINAKGHLVIADNIFRYLEKYVLLMRHKR